MKRTLPFVLMIAAGAFAYACSDDGDPNGTTDTPDGSTNETGTQPGTDGSTTDGGDTPDGEPSGTDNPIEGIAAPKVIADALDFVDGPVWFNGTLYVSRPLDRYLLSVNLGSGTVGQVRQGTAGVDGVIGNAVDKAGNLVSAERNSVTRTMLDGGAVTEIASEYGIDGGTEPFDSPNDLVVRDDGTIYVTDPGYLGTITDGFNHLVKIAPNGTATLLENFTDVPRPNGIALTRDQKTLYVGFSRPTIGTKPYVRKYTVKTDGTLENPQPFVEFATPSAADPGPNDDPDGIAVDDGGNVYVTYRLGVNVYKADGTRYGGQPSVAIPGEATGIAFSGAGDRKTAYVTTKTGKIYEVKFNVPGVVQ